MIGRELMKGRSARLPIRVDDYAVYIGGRFSLSFQRTLRVPDIGPSYPVPPRMGNFRIHRVEDYLGTVPAGWAEMHHDGREGIFIPMYRCEALWLAFGGVSWKPNAVQVGLGGSNVLSGEPLEAGLHGAPQNYIISPHQPWLAGMRSLELGMRHKDPDNVSFSQFRVPQSLEVVVYDPRPSIFPSEPPRQHTWPYDSLFEESVQPFRLGLQDEGREAQFALPDPYGQEAWELEPCGRVDVHLVNTAQFQQITGHEPPHTPVTTDAYSAAGLPWLDSYEEE